MDEFGQRVQEWQLFYATIAGSSATLVGLLFVALSVNPDAVNSAKDAGIRLLARQTFTTFLYIIGIALTFLIPRQVPLGIGLPLALISILGLRITLAELRAAQGSATQGTGVRNVLRRVALKVAAFLLLMAIALGVLVWANGAILGLMVAPMLILLISASLNTWVLLVAVQDASAKG
jgi:hypothetical protein